MWKNSLLKENTQLNDVLQLCLNVSGGITESNEEWKARKETVGRSDMERKSRKWKTYLFSFILLSVQFSDALPWSPCPLLTWLLFLKPESKVHRQQGRFAILPLSLHGFLYLLLYGSFRVIQTHLSMLATVFCTTESSTMSLCLYLYAL